jgi:hypothetical protein
MAAALVLAAAVEIGLTTRGQEPCPPATDYRDQVPVWLALPPAAELPGVVLPPVTADPTRWEVPRGAYSRTGRACDPDGDAFSVELVSATIPAEVAVDPAAGTWTLTATIPRTPRKHLVHLRATDEFGASQDFLVPLARENAAPRLQ